MKERKRYENPDIKVISIRENSDIIQTSGEILSKFANIANAPTSAQSIVNSNNNIRGLFSR